MCLVGRVEETPGFGREKTYMRFRGGVSCVISLEELAKRRAACAPPNPPIRPSSPHFGDFDRWAERLVSGEVKFEVFAVNVKADITRMAYAARRRRNPPNWMDTQDIETLLLEYCWYYAFQHKTREGRIGFDPTRGTSAGAYLRWNAGQRVQKVIGKARGENMHTHRLEGGAKEILSTDGMVEEKSSGGYGEEQENGFDEVRKTNALGYLVTELKQFVSENEIVKSFGSKTTREQVVSFVLLQPEPVKRALGIKKPKDARKFWSLFVQHGFARTDTRLSVGPESGVALCSETLHPIDEAVDSGEFLLAANG